MLAILLEFGILVSYSPIPLMIPSLEIFKIFLNIGREIKQLRKRE